jgi:hypothetical protein
VFVCSITVEHLSSTSAKATWHLVVDQEELFDPSDDQLRLISADSKLLREGERTWR